MSYFGALAEGAFKPDRDGRRLFFPWGSLGAGYVMRDDEDRARVRATLVRIHQAGHAAAIPLVFLAPPWLGLVLLPPLLVAYAAWVRRATAGFERSSERLSLDESLETQARLHRPWVLWLFLAVSAAFTVAGAHMLVSDRDQWLVAGTNLFLSGGFTVLAWRMLRAARRGR